jgi:predicted nucleic acid-binding protein
VVTRILVDTSALIALLDADDPRQAAVREAFDQRADDELVTHGYIIAEAIAVTRRRFGVAGAATLVDDILPAISLVPVDVATHAAALERYRASLPTAVSFVDHVTLAVMERVGIDTAIVLDPDFAGRGFQIIPTT